MEKEETSVLKRKQKIVYNNWRTFLSYQIVISCKENNLLCQLLLFLFLSLNDICKFSLFQWYLFLKWTIYLPCDSVWERKKRVKIFSWFIGNYSFLILKQGIHFYSTWKRFKSSFSIKKCCLFLRAPVWHIKWTIKLSTSLCSIRPSQNYLRQLLLAAKIV